MAKSKPPTPQELYRARKQREEQEKTAFLPPGLVNHGNTCFMNSVLQGLIATRLLAGLAHFSPIAPSIQQNSGPTPASWRSPLLTNGHKLGGRFEQGWVDTMPIGDVFLDLMVRAWQGQSRKTREILSPKPLLGVLGRKYEQYLDFAQQDAHEFLRILLDATRMEEFDVIKKRQPPPENAKKRRRTTITPSSIDPSPHAEGPSPQPRAIPEEEKLMTLADMIFGGKFASILVCQKCKNVSQTYEDFNDISLSIKAEDYHERKRDRLKHFAKRLTSFPTPSLGVNNEIPRPSSVPPSPRERESQLGHEEPPTVYEPRRRSLDVVGDTGQDPDSDQSATAWKDGTTALNETPVVVNGHGNVAGEGKHIEIASSAKPEKKDKKDDGWTKIGRRISMTVGLGKPHKKRKSRSRDRSSKDLSRSSLQLDAPQVVSVSSTSTEGSASTRSDKHSSASEARRGSSPSTLAPSPLTPPTRINGHDPVSSARTPSPRPTTARPRHSFASQQPHVQRGKSPKPPKPSPGELNYLREILADITPASSSNPFTLFKPPHHQPNTGNRSVSSPAATQNLWLSMNHFSGIEECLRMFTSVEIMDGENMVGCRRCWKIANGEYEKHSAEEGNGDEDSDSVGHDSADSHSQPVSNSVAKPALGLSPLRPPAAHIPTSMSTPTVSFYSHTNTSDDRSVSSLPTTEATSLPETDIDATPSVRLLPIDDQRPTTPGGLPIPFISTTGPDSPTTRSDPPPSNGVMPSQPLESSSSLPLGETGTPIAQPTPRLGQILNHLPPPNHADSLPLPKLRRPFRPDVDTEESSGAESDASAATSTRSMESSTSTNHPSTGPTQHAAAAVRKNPKPVIMRPAYKRYLIGTPPPVLVIHLKRFQQINKTHLLSFSHGFKKLDDFVTFPEFLDLTPYLAPRKEDFGLGKKAEIGQGFVKRAPRRKGEKCMYRLYAVVVHIGNMLGGHYVAYTALPDPQPPRGSASDQTPEVPSTDVKPPRQWAYISDTIVRLTTLEEVLKAKAYICMYERI